MKIGGIFIKFLLIASLALNTFIPSSIADLSPTALNVTETNFEVNITTKAKKDPQIDTGKEVQKVKRPLLPYTGLPSYRYLYGMLLSIFGAILIYQEWSEKR